MPRWRIQLETRCADEERADDPRRSLSPLRLDRFPQPLTAYLLAHTLLASFWQRQWANPSQSGLNSSSTHTNSVLQAGGFTASADKSADGPLSPNEFRDLKLLKKEKVSRPTGVVRHSLAGTARFACPASRNTTQECWAQHRQPMCLPACLTSPSVPPVCPAADPQQLPPQL